LDEINDLDGAVAGAKLDIHFLPPEGRFINAGTDVEQRIEVSGPVELKIK